MIAPNKRLGQLFSRILEGASVEVRDPARPGGPARLSATGQFGDASLRVIWAGDGWPADVREALAAIPPGPWPSDLVVAAHRISPGALTLLGERGANWVDESGGAHIVGPGILVIRQGTVPEAVAPAFAWSPSALATAEALLARAWPGGMGTTELATLIGWSPPQVSQILQAFDERGWTEKYGPQRGRGARRELADPGGMLNAWADFIAGEEREVRLTHRTLRAPLDFLEAELAAALDREVRWAISGWAAAHELAPMADAVPSLQIYVHEDDFGGQLDRAIRAARLSDVAEGGRVAFFPAHPSILAMAQPSSPAAIVSAPRVYADLLSLGGRGTDAAEHLKEEVIDRLHPPRGQRHPPAGMLDWEQRCQARLRQLTEDRPDLWALYAQGTWSVSYRLLGSRREPGLRQLIGILREVAGDESGWPPWWVPGAGPNGPHAVDGMVECWHSEMLPGNPSEADLWRADPRGRLFLIRGYQEDSPDEGLAREPGTRLDLALPIRRAAECLLHAERLARRLDAASIQMTMRWTGLRGRQLASLVSRRRRVLSGTHASQDEAFSFAEIVPSEVRAEPSGIVKQLVDPLYETFEFFEPDDLIYEEVLAEMSGSGRR